MIAKTRSIKLNLWIVALLLPASSLFAQKIRLDERSTFGPSVTEHYDVMVVAWTGTDGRINIMQSRDGIDWGSKIRLDEQSNHPPVIASDGDYLYLAWTGRSDNKLNVIQSRDGIDWGSKIRLDEESDLAPGLAVVDRRVYMV